MTEGKLLAIMSAYAYALKYETLMIKYNNAVICHPLLTAAVFCSFFVFATQLTVYYMHYRNIYTQMY